MIYEEPALKLLSLNFFNSELHVKSEQKDFIPQEPQQQEFIVQYPYLCYKSARPTDSELILVHMAVDMTPIHIDLNGWKFLQFVGHNLGEESDYSEQNQSTVQILFLAKKDGQKRLMYFQSNPWNIEKDYTGVSDRGKFVSTSVNVHLFSGVVHWFDDKLDVRRATSDKVQDIQLLTSMRARYR